MVYEVFSLVLAYFIGSVNPAYFLGLAKRVDLRKKGKYKNYGAANVLSLFGWRWFIFIAVVDILKGILAALIPVFLGLPWFYAYLAAALAVVGHRFPFYLGFKGGKGVAAGSGGFGILLLLNHDLIAVVLAIIFFSYAVAVSPKFRSRIFGFIGVKA